MDNMETFLYSIDVFDFDENNTDHDDRKEKKLRKEVNIIENGSIYWQGIMHSIYCLLLF